jgi:probable phosphoglycerate mutase
MTLPARTNLLIIRHGETLWNVQERYQGHGDSSLTETGRNQVAALARRLKEIRFKTLISSDLGRTRETAAIISDCTGHAVETDSRLRERNYGVLEGLTVPEIQAEYAEVLERLNTGDPDYIVPGGESQRQHYRRNVAFIEDLLAERSGAEVAIVTHGGVLDSIFRYVARLALDHPRCFVTKNASLSVISHGNFYGAVQWVIGTWGDVAHLNGIGWYVGLGWAHSRGAPVPEYWSGGVPGMLECWSAEVTEYWSTGYRTWDSSVL